MCPCDTWTMENVTYCKMNSRVRESFLSLEENKIKKKSMGKGRNKGKKKKRKEKEKQKEGGVRESERKKR